MRIRIRALHLRSWQKLIMTLFVAGLTSLLLAASGLTVRVADAAIIHPEYTKPILDPATQPHWVTGIPNALASYFTFTPFASDNAAVAAGLPSGVCGPGPTQEDCYAVSVRQFQQNLGLVVEGSYVPGVSPGVPLMTTVWGYGSATNAPSVGPFTAGVWHFPAPTFQNRSNRPSRIIWGNELPNVKPAGFDPSYDCGPNAPNCYPYNRITTHVHGAHVADDSDGLTTAWYTPVNPATGVPFAVGPDYEQSKYGPTGTYRYENTQEAATIWYHDHAMGTTHTNTNQGMAGFFSITDSNEDTLRGIPNPSTKVLPTGDYELGFALQDRNFWPDGSLAMPDTPIYNMLADSVNCAINPTTNVINPLCPAVAFSKNAGGALIAYNAAIATPALRGPYTATGRPFTPCTIDPLLGIIPNTCPEVPFSKAPAPESNLIPYSAAIVDPLLRGPFTAPSGTLEYFGNIPIVNGVAYGTYNVEPRLYRMRFIGGTDSRTWILQLQVRGTGNPAAVPPVPDTVIPFWQIGTDQGFLNKPVLRNMIVLMPGERIDVLVDFSAITTANAKVVLANLGPDMPYGGVYVPIDRSVDIPEIMEFISLGTAGLSAVPEVTRKPVVPAAPLNIDGYVDTAIALRPTAALIAPNNLTPTAGTPVRNVSLIEVTDQFGRTMPTIDNRGFMPPMVPITEVIRIGDTEQWDIINTTVDSHPMHLHQTAFQLIDRQDLPLTVDPVTGLATGFVMPVTDTMNAIFSQPTYTTIGVPLPPEPWDQAWKDTIECPPGKVTRVKAKFDIPGFYVWHCHILSHEEHDMMRPMVVTTPLTPTSTVNLTSSVSGNTQLSGSAAPVTFTAAALSGISAYPEPMSFEYQFTVTPPTGVTVTQPTLPPTRMTMIAGSTPGYSMIRQAVWTPSTVPGTYVVTVKAKAIGAANNNANIGTGTLNYTVIGPEITGVTSTTLSGVYRSGAKVNVTLAFNQNVSSTNGLTITLNSGATLSTGRLTNVSTFSGTYTIAANQNTPAGQFLDVNSITGTVTDASGNSMNKLTVPLGVNLSNNKQIVIDTTPPSLSLTNPTSTLVNSASITVDGTATDMNGIQSLTVNGSPVSVGSGNSFSTTVSLVSGLNTLSVVATDLAGNQTMVVQSITLDTVKPVTTVTPAGGTYSGTVTVTLSANKPGSTVYYTIDGSTPSTSSTIYTGPVTLSVSATTTYIVQYFAVDPAGNKESVKSVNYTVHVSDLTASIKINDGATMAKSANVTLTLSATDPLGVSSMQVACDGITFGAVELYGTSRACTLPSGEGLKTVAVKFIDTVGTVYPPVTAQITLDLTPPALTVTSPTSTLVNNATATVAGTASDKNGIQSLTVNGATAAVGANGTFSKDVILASGANTITIIATDNAGNQTTRIRNMTLDTVLPITTISPAAGTYTGKVSVSLTSSKTGSTIYYTTNGSTPTTASPVYTGPVVLAAAATTTYPVQYFSVDPAGNIEQIRNADYVVHVSDLTASVIINNGALLTKSADVSLNLAATDPVGVPNMQVACDGTTFGAVELFAASRACSLPTGDGIKTVAVKFIDGVGTVYAPVTAQITLDTAPPVASATPDAGIYAGAVSVALSVNESATIFYTTNGTTPTTASSTYIAPILLSSSTTADLALSFLAVDQAGNAGTVQTLNYTIHQPDLTASMTINNGASLTASQNVTLSISASDPAGVSEMQVACDGSNFAAVEPYAVTRSCILTSGDGLKTVLAKFKDALGNWYPPINAQITLDTVAPFTVATPAAGTYSNSVTIVLTGNETSTIYYTTDGSVPAVGATPGPAVYVGPFSLTPTSTTNYTVKYLAVDGAGNTEAVKNADYTVHVNDLVGSIRINGGAPYTATVDTVLTLAASDPATVTEMQFSNDGVSYTPFEPYATARTWILNGGTGVRTVYVRFKDGTGTIYAPYSAEIVLSPAAAAIPVGDLNGDRIVDIADALRALQISVGLFQSTVDERIRGDVAPLVTGKPSPDGVIDSGDVLIILKRLLALTTW